MMRLLIAASLALASCTAAPVAQIPAPPAPDVVAKAGTVVLSGRRAFAAAEISYITAADGVGRLVDRGVIKGALATRVRGWNAEAGEALRKGKSTADAAAQGSAAATLFGVSDRLNALIGSK
jgi:hypothetical protein